MASKLNLNIEQGATFSIGLELTDDTGVTFDLDGYTGRSQMRRSHSSSTAIDLDVTITDMTGGNLTLSKTAATTASITAGRYVYDLEVFNASGVVKRIVEGVATVLPEVTKS
jgi:hypothetical protein